MRMMLLLCCLVVTAMAAPGNHEGNTNHFISLINKRQKQWRAGLNNFKFTIKELNGVYDINGTAKKLHDDLPVIKHDLTDVWLPVNFDARRQWRHCPSLREIRDQSNCGSSWAFGAVEAMTDRICILSKGKKNYHISAQEVLTCCRNCGEGCGGGFPVSAWRYFNIEGIVTGGQYGSNMGCQPYTLKPCDHHVTGQYEPCIGHAETPRCVKQCTNRSYNVSFSDDKHYGLKPYSVKGVEQIKVELVNNGPVQAVFNLYSDFPQYKSGVYRHTHGALLGTHAVKILGYGLEIELNIGWLQTPGMRNGEIMDISRSKGGLTSVALKDRLSLENLNYKTFFK